LRLTCSSAVLNEERDRAKGKRVVDLGRKDLDGRTSRVDAIKGNCFERESAVLGFESTDFGDDNWTKSTRF
jgi:hypothetical protein